MQERHSITVLAIIWMIGHSPVVTSDRPRQWCDLRMWYLNIITNDVFHIDLSEKQMKLKESIEALMMKSSNNKETKIDCNVVYMYNDMLKEQFNYEPVNSLSHITINEETQRSDTNNAKDLGGEVTLTEIANENDFKSNQETTEYDHETLETDNYLYDEHQSNTNSRNEMERRESTQGSSNSISHQTEAIFTDTEMPITSSEIEKSERTNEIDNTEDHNTEENMDSNKYERQRDIINIMEVIDESEIDETDIIENNNEDVEVKTDVNEYEITMPSRKDSYKTKRIPFGICRSFGCFQMERYDSQMQLEQTSTKLPDVYKLIPERRLNHICDLGAYCRNKCYYILSVSHCLLGFKMSSNNKNNITKSKDKIPSNVTDKMSEKEVHTTKVIEEHRKPDVPEIQSVDMEVVNIEHGKTTPKEFVKVEFPENPNVQTEVAIEQSEEKYKSIKQTWGKIDSENTYSSTDFPFKQFEDMIHQKTTEYAQKIQTLELMLLKLENQLLTERLNKQDHSSTITRLENLILRLENDLLRMGKKYEILKEETENISKNQNKYLEIAQKTENKYPQLPHNNVNNEEELSKQEIKINKITALINNLTNTVHQIEKRSDYLDKQYQNLHQMVINQTMFMSRIIQTVQNITEQIAGQKQESSELTEKIDKVLLNNLETSQEVGTNRMFNAILDSLKKYVSDDKINARANEETNEADAENKMDASDTHVDISNNLSVKNTEKTLIHWCSKEFSAFPFCYHHSIMQLKCIPFNTIFWNNCTNRYKHLPDENVSMDKNNMPEEPKVTDNKSDNEKHELSDQFQDSTPTTQDTVGKQTAYDRNIYTNKRPVLSDLQKDEKLILNSNANSNTNKDESDQLDPTKESIMGCKECETVSKLNNSPFDANILSDKIQTTSMNAEQERESDIPSVNVQIFNKHEEKENQQIKLAEQNTEEIHSKSEDQPSQPPVEKDSTQAQKSQRIKATESIRNEKKNITQANKPPVAHNTPTAQKDKTPTKGDTYSEGDKIKPTHNQMKMEIKNTQDEDVLELSTTAQKKMTLAKIDAASELDIHPRNAQREKSMTGNVDIATEAAGKQTSTKGNERTVSDINTSSGKADITILETSTVDKAISPKSTTEKEQIIQDNVDTTLKQILNHDSNTNNQNARMELPKKDEYIYQDSNSEGKEPIQSAVENKILVVKDDKNESFKVNSNPESNKQNSGEMTKGTKQVHTEITKEHKSKPEHKQENTDNTQTKEIGTQRTLTPEPEVIVVNKSNTLTQNISEKTKPIQDKQDKQKEKTTGSERPVPINLVMDKQKEPKDCYDYYSRGQRKDGTYKVRPVGSTRMIQVYCDMKQGGWTLIHKRQDGTTNFFQEWEDYKTGFGGLYGEHWLGNDNIHLLTNQDYYTLRVDLMDWSKNRRYALYTYFLVENEDTAYRLHIDGYSGDAGDGLSKHDGHKFSTKDVDNDKVVKEFGGSCANRFQGAGWYYKCYSSNLNGKYYRLGKIPEKKFDGVTWKPWMGPNYSMKTATMKIRPMSAQ